MIGFRPPVAEALNSWLEDLLPGIQPWVSTEDIAKGSAWFPALLGRLEFARLCLICVTPESVRSPWFYFGAGAIAGKGARVRVCAYLVGVDFAQLYKGPLGHFQCPLADKIDTWRLVRDINQPKSERSPGSTESGRWAASGLGGGLVLAKRHLYQST